MNNRQRFLSILKDNERDMRALFSSLVNQVAGMITRSADASGHITNADALRRNVRQAVTALFLVRSLSGELMPFDVLNGQIVPLSPFMQVLWRHVTAATEQGVTQNANQMGRILADSPEVLRALRSASRDPFMTHGVREAIDPWAQYEPMHTWVDANGYRLSERIWRLTNDARRRIDLYLDDAIRLNKSALEMARELEDLLIPGRALRRTSKPYGTDVSADAMRLARTEITAAHTRAQMMSAQLNPFVDSYDVVLSPSHKCCDECDSVVAGSPYAKGQGPMPPIHPHCLCYVRFNVAQSQGQIIASLRAQVRDQINGRSGGARLVDLIGPLQTAAFVRLLLKDRQRSGVVDNAF